METVKTYEKYVSARKILKSAHSLFLNGCINRLELELIARCVRDADYENVRRDVFASIRYEKDVFHGRDYVCCGCNARFTQVSNYCPYCGASHLLRYDERVEENA